MSSDRHRAVPGDPDAPLVMLAFEHSDLVLLAQPGPIDTFAAQTFQNDGSSFQTVVGVQLQARHNHDHGPHATQTVTILLPTDCITALVDQLTHSGAIAVEAENRRTR